MGTFNMADRSVSAHGRGANPKGDYEPAQRGPAEPVRPEDQWPNKVKGGFVFDHIEHTEEPEFRRKSGALLPRNILGNCTVQDQYKVYYGADGRHYGHQVGTYNQKQYSRIL